MTDREKLEIVYDYVKRREDYFYQAIENGRYEPGSIGAMQCMFQAASFQQIRYLIEELMEEDYKKDQRECANCGRFNKNTHGCGKYVDDCMKDGDAYSNWIPQNNTKGE